MTTNVHTDSFGDTLCSECDEILDTDLFSDDELADESAWILCQRHMSEAYAEQWAEMKAEW